MLQTQFVFVGVAVLYNSSWFLEKKDTRQLYNLVSSHTSSRFWVGCCSHLNRDGSRRFSCFSQESFFSEKNRVFDFCSGGYCRVSNRELVYRREGRRVNDRTQAKKNVAPRWSQAGGWGGHRQLQHDQLLFRGEKEKWLPFVMINQWVYPCTVISLVLFLFDVVMVT